MSPPVLHPVISYTTHYHALLKSGKRCATVLPSTVPPVLNPRSTVFVDASSTWGIGVYTDGLWDAWCYPAKFSFLPKDINRLEALAVEIGVRTIQARGLQATIFSDNTGVIRALNSKKIRDTFIDASVKRTFAILEAQKMKAQFLYVSTKHNLADAYSRGRCGLPEKRIVRRLHLPREMNSLVMRANFW